MIPRVSVVVTARDEGEEIVSYLDRLLESISLSCEVLVVYDSPDDVTAPWLRDYGEQVLPHEMKGRSHDMIKPGGLGLYLIRNAFDEVDYIHKGRGTELVLTKNLE